MKLILPQNMTESSYLILSCLFMPLTSVISSIIPLLTAEAVDTLSTSNPTAASSFIMYICIIKILGVILGVTWKQLMSMHFMKCSQRAELEGVEKVLHLDLHYIHRMPGGDVLKKIEQGGEAVQMFGEKIIGGAVPTCIQLVAAIGVLVSTGAGITAFGIGVSSLLYILVTSKGTLTLRKYQRRLLSTIAEFNGEEIQAVTQAATIKSFAAEERQIAKLRMQNDTIIADIISMTVVGSCFLVLQVCIQESGLAAALVMASTLVASNALTPGGFVMVQMFVTQLFGPLTALASQFQTAFLAHSQMESWCDIVWRSPAVMDAPDAKHLKEHLLHNPNSYSVEFYDVRFLYSASSPVILQGITFHALHGGSIALVGSSGSGKSTCFQLMMRFYDVVSGCVKVCGIDVRRVSQQSLRSVVGLIPQETVLFNDSIISNVRMGKPQATAEEVKDVLARVQLAAFLAKHGIEAQVGDPDSATPALPNGIKTLRWAHVTRVHVHVHVHVLHAT